MFRNEIISNWDNCSRSLGKNSLTNPVSAKHKRFESSDMSTTTFADGASIPSVAHTEHILNSVLGNDVWS